MLEGDWVVTRIVTDGELGPPVEGSRLTLTISEDRISGTSGVNRFFGKIDGERFVEPIGSTRMFGPPELMDQEGRYLSYLVPESTLKVDGETLLIVSGDKTVVEMVPGDPENEEFVERI